MFGLILGCPFPACLRPSRLAMVLTPIPSDLGPTGGLLRTGWSLLLLPVPLLRLRPPRMVPRMVLMRSLLSFLLVLLFLTMFQQVAPSLSPLSVRLRLRVSTVALSTITVGFTVFAALLRGLSGIGVMTARLRCA